MPPNKQKTWPENDEYRLLASWPKSLPIEQPISSRRWPGWKKSFEPWKMAMWGWTIRFGNMRKELACCDKPMPFWRRPNGGSKY